MKIIAIIGYSGFVGNNLSTYLKEHNYNIKTIDRETLNNNKKLNFAISDVDVVINLAGAKILTRWSKKNRQNIYNSRVLTTKKIAKAINNINPLIMLINTSAVGIYNDDYHDESSTKFRDSYLGTICKDWEKEAKACKNHVICRFGVVLHSSGGLINSVKIPTKLFGGVYFGNANNSIPVINLKDLLRAYKFIIEANKCDTYNLVSENIQNKTLSTKIAKFFNRSIVFKIPALLIKFVLLDGAEPILSNQKIEAKKLKEAGFTFKYTKSKLFNF